MASALSAPRRTALAVAQSERLAELEAFGRVRPLTDAESREVERLVRADQKRRWEFDRRVNGQLARARAKVAAGAAA